MYRYCKVKPDKSKRTNTLPCVVVGSGSTFTQVVTDQGVVLYKAFLTMPGPLGEYIRFTTKASLTGDGEGRGSLLLTDGTY